MLVGEWESGGETFGGAREVGVEGGDTRVPFPGAEGVDDGLDAQPRSSPGPSRSDRL
jgi:hypothetical protein